MSENSETNDSKFLTNYFNNIELQHSILEAAIKTCIELEGVNSEILSHKEISCLEKHARYYHDIMKTNKDISD